MSQHRVWWGVLITILWLMTPQVSTVSVAEAVNPPTVLITGSNRGIGLGLTRAYAEAGWQVLATCRNPEGATELAALAKQHPLVEIERLDVTDADGIAALAEKIADRPIDVIINNAGIIGNPRTQTWGNLDIEQYQDVLAVNTIGPLLVAEAFLPHLRRGQQKKILNVSTSEASFAADRGPARIPFYRSSKAALNMLMLNYAKMAAQEGIAVGLANPGPVDTDMMKGVNMPLRSVELAAAELIAIVDKLDVDNSGKFWDYDGSELAW